MFRQQTERYCMKKKVIQRPRFILIDKVASRSCVTGKQGFFILMTSFYFYLLGGVFTKHSKTVGYFVFLILFRSILPLIKIILIKTQFVHFISLNITILLCLQFANLDCNKILTSISQLYHLTISCVKINGE